MRKKAVLAVSFGTAYMQACEKTIKVIENHLGSELDLPVYRAWTAGTVISLLKKKNKIDVDTVEQAMNRMYADAVTDILVQPTYVIGGYSYMTMLKAAEENSERFKGIVYGAPLLNSEKDYADVIQSVLHEFWGIPADTALVFMGNGSVCAANAAYAALDYHFKDCGCGNIFIGTYEAYPRCSTVIRHVLQSGYKKVILAPFMTAAGKHALEDMAGDGEHSWKSRFTLAGCSVKCVMRGLGEYEGIREIFINHAKLAQYNGDVYV